ncbi:hypothetical protein B484DRAFT_132180 [Ochromonadaceae sp. CCMP2298]|nr:hypothetical protein B484DRAFT_132180 [Ochromonadaceae sp. CCMP2298]
MDEGAGLLGSRQRLLLTRHHLTCSQCNHSWTGGASSVSSGSGSGSGGSGSSGGGGFSSISSSTSRDSSSTPTPTLPSDHLQYYIDASAPLGVRAALLEGVGWWDRAFQAAGFPPDTFRAKVAYRLGEGEGEEGGVGTGEGETRRLKGEEAQAGETEAETGAGTGTQTGAGTGTQAGAGTGAGAGDGSAIYLDPYSLSPGQHFVEWIDRDLRAYSLGIRISDPRSGQVLHGHVRIENLRVRQDALIAEALLGPFPDEGGEGQGQGGEGVSARMGTAGTDTDTGAGAGAGAVGGTGAGSSFSHKLHALLHTAPTQAGAGAGAEGFSSRDSSSSTSNSTSSSSPSLQSAVLGAILARVRQLGAHEVGHTLGLAHNFAGSASTTPTTTSTTPSISTSTPASTYSSVMDYPPPIVTLLHGVLTLNNQSYSPSIGTYDIVAIRYGYVLLDPLLSAPQQTALLAAGLIKAAREGYVFLTDQDADDGGADWRATRMGTGVEGVGCRGRGIRGCSLGCTAQK